MTRTTFRSPGKYFFQKFKLGLILLHWYNGEFIQNEEPIKFYYWYLISDLICEVSSQTNNCLVKNPHNYKNSGKQ